MAFCAKCGEEYSDKRKSLGYTTCLGCGSPNKVRTIVPLHKSGYMVVSDLEDLKGLNKGPKQ